MKTLQQQLGEELKAIRLKNNMSQQEAADYSGMDQKHISRVERGVIRSITVPTVERIAAIYGKKVKIKFVR